MSLLSLSVHLQKMLCFSPSKRITASEALLHPYFSEYGFEPLSFSPSSSSSSRSMRTSDASSSFNSSFLSSSSHNESGGSMGDPNQWTTRSVTVMNPNAGINRCAPEQVQHWNPGAHPSAIVVRPDLEPESSQPRIHHIISVKDFFLFKWCYYVHRVENVAITALLHITFAYRLKTTKISSLSLYQSNITTHITDKSMIFWWLLVPKPQ